MRHLGDLGSPGAYLGCAVCALSSTHRNGGCCNGLCVSFCVFPKKWYLQNIWCFLPSQRTATTRTRESDQGRPVTPRLDRRGGRSPERAWSRPRLSSAEDRAQARRLRGRRPIPLVVFGPSPLLSLLGPAQGEDKSRPASPRQLEAVRRFIRRSRIERRTRIGPGGWRLLASNEGIPGVLPRLVQRHAPAPKRANVVRDGQVKYAHDGVEIGPASAPCWFVGSGPLPRPGRSGCGQGARHL
mmetsp:Transcript_19662/g.45453  ORF Transcript_19662/g.45453 Transcript_19662/m.45453 type:complete len:241 (-) Transcript_19662:1813-2535(-)